MLSLHKNLQRIFTAAHHGLTLKCLPDMCSCFKPLVPSLWCNLGEGSGICKMWKQATEEGCWRWSQPAFVSVILIPCPMVQTAPTTCCHYQWSCSPGLFIAPGDWIFEPQPDISPRLLSVFWSQWHKRKLIPHLIHHCRNHGNHHDVLEWVSG